MKLMLRLYAAPLSSCIVLLRFIDSSHGACHGWTIRTALSAHVKRAASSLDVWAVMKGSSNVWLHVDIAITTHAARGLRGLRLWS